MPKRKASHAEISAFVHATEDLSKVRSAITKILSDQIAHKVEFTQTKMLGHHRNPIIELRVAITNKRDAYEILQGIISRLSPLDETILDKELAKHLDKKNRLYLRLDKQRAFIGEATLTSGDAISLRFSLRSRPRSLKELKTDLGINENNGDGTDANQ